MFFKVPVNEASFFELSGHIMFGMRKHILHYLIDFGLSFENQLNYLQLNLKNSDIHKKEFKKEKFDFINELDKFSCK